MNLHPVPAILMALVTLGCQVPPADLDAAHASAADRAVADLVAAQTETYAVPATQAGVAFTVAASMAGVRWASLSEQDLRAWWLLWSSLCEPPCPITEPYQDAAGTSANLFERSARDGFCVALAHRSAKKLNEPRVLEYLRGLSSATSSQRPSSQRP